MERFLMMPLNLSTWNVLVTLKLFLKAGSPFLADTPLSLFQPGALSSSIFQVWFESTLKLLIVKDTTSFLSCSGKLGTFHCTKPSSSWKLLFPLMFLIAPMTIALSRTADYHHHWQDVVVGSALGLSIVWIVYRQVSILNTLRIMPKT